MGVELSKYIGELDAGYKLLSRIRKHVKTWDQPAYVLDALQKMRAQELRHISIAGQGFPWTEWCVLDPSWHTTGLPGATVEFSLAL